MEFFETHLGSTGAQTLVWAKDELIDWVGARIYRLDGETTLANLGVAHKFDSALAVPDGRG